MLDNNSKINQGRLSERLSNEFRNDSHQPSGLRVLFFAEMWERFSYYGMRSLLVLYLINSLSFSRDNALELYGIYTGLVYLTPIYGGAIADKYLGKRRALLIGAFLMVLGHFCMVFESLLYVALGLLIVGNGFFKPNASSLVGELYGLGEEGKRSAGYSIFYMGINLGAFLAPLVAGTLGERVGWHYGFACAGVGMTFGAIQLLMGQDKLGRIGLKEHQNPVDFSDTKLILIWVGASATFVFATIYSFEFFSPWLDSLSKIQKLILELSLLAGVLVYLLNSKSNSPGELSSTAPKSNHSMSKSDWSRVIAILIVMLFVIVFWTGFEQAGGTMTLFAEQNTNRELFGFLIPTSSFQAINPALIILLAPLFSIIWIKLDSSKYSLSDIGKQSLGMIILGLGFLVMSHAQNLSDTLGRVGPEWLFMVYAIHTAGELMLSPVGLAMVSRVSPSKLSALLMGVWLLSSAIAGYMSGTLESILRNSDFSLYPFLATISISAGIILFILSPSLNKMMRS
ncbi:MAG: peptide MFS transporter [Betaproteobacteria bacterium]|nr:peptide MFS transporter [Betaproteobacteria bacterium]